MLASLGILAALICIISVIMWIIVALLKKSNLKRIFKNIGLVLALIFLICGFATACTHSGNSNKDGKTENVSKEYKYKKFKIYSVTVTSTKVNSDGDLIVKGTSEAPEGAKVLAESNIDYSNDTNEASPTDLDNYGYEKIKNGKFNITLDVTDLFGSDELKVGQKLKPTIFAVTGYSVKYDDYKITSDLRKAVKKSGLKPFIYTATKDMCKKINDDGSDDSDDSDDDSDSSDDTNEDSEDTDTSSNKKSKGLSKSEKIAAALVILKKNYKGKAEVKYSSSADMFTILPTMDGYRDILDDAEDGDTSEWETVTDSIDEVSKSLYKDVKLKIPVSLVNPDDTSKVLYTSIDGLSSYDFTDDN